MANQAPTSSAASLRRAAVEELRSFDWELVDAEDLYADVESLDSFSISSGDGEDGQEIDECVGKGSDRDCCDDPEAVDLEVSGVGLKVSGGCVDLEEEACGGGLIEQVGFHVDEDRVLEVSEGVDRGVYGEEEVESVGVGGMRELRAPTSLIRGEYVENHRRRGLLDLDEDEDGDGGYEVDVDDELVPWGVADRLEKQRMRKLGKRSFAKMNKSKKLAHFYTQPACVHGKHGLGLKAY